MPYDCGYTDFTVEVEIFDNDGDSLEATASFGLLNLPLPLMNTNQPGGPGNPAVYTYAMHFDMELFGSCCRTENLTITADECFNSPA